MDRAVERDNRGVRSEAVTPEDQVVMTAPRAYLLGYLKASDEAGKDIRNILIEIKHANRDITIIMISSIVLPLLILSAIVLKFF